MTKKEEKEMREEALKKASEANQNQNNERLKLMEQIADSADMEKQKDEEKPPEIEEAEETAKELQEEVKEEAPIVGDEKEIDGVKYYLTIVNGHEKWLSLKQLRETAAKVEAADEYLRTAAEAARNAAAGVPSKDEPPSLGEDEIADLLRKQALGEDEATSRLAKLIAKPSGVTPDVLRALDQRLSFRTELASLEAQSADLLKDPYMGRLFRTRLEELKREAPNTTLSDAYQSIDKELRTAFPGYKSSKLNEKLERKRTLPTLPTAGTRKPDEAEEEGEEDPAQVIEKMAKARGLAPHVHSRRQ
jgi:hypothetical protein